MITTFLGAMTPDGYNPYRIGRDGIDWEVVDPHDPWSHIGYWGDHQVIYLLRLLEAAQARDPALLPGLWDRALFSFADVPYRLKPHAEQVAQPKHTIDFDDAAHRRAHERAQRSWAPTACWSATTHGQPVLATLAEKLAVIVLAKAGSLVPGGGLWLHTQRPGVERRQQRAGRQRAVGGHAGLPAPLPGLRGRAARRRAPLRAAASRRCDALQAFHALLQATPRRRWPTTPRRGAPSSTVPARCSTAGARRPTAAPPAARPRRRPPGCCRRWRATCCRWSTRRCSARAGPTACSTATTWSTSTAAAPKSRACTRCSKARWRCCPAACCGRPRPSRCSTRCSPARCTRRGTAASCSTRTARCPASWSATGWTARRWRCRSCSSCWPPAAPTCCSGRATARCASRRG